MLLTDMRQYMVGNDVYFAAIGSQYNLHLMDISFGLGIARVIC